MKELFSFFLFILGGLHLMGCQMLDNPYSPDAQLVFIDVGQGDAGLIQNSEGHYGLIDAGPDNSASFTWLKSNSVKKLDWLLITHADLDHYGGASQIIEEIEVKKVYLPLDSNPHPSWKALRELIRHKSIPADTLYKADRFSIMEGVLATVLWPPKNSGFEGNRASTVLELEISGALSIFPGDIDSSIEYEIIPQLPLERVQLLKLAHHGSAGSNSFAFLANINPQWAVVSCDSSVYGHPAPSVAQKLYGILPDSNSFLRTDKMGTISFSISSNGIMSLQ